MNSLINISLFNKIPNDIIINNIIPYTYNIVSKDLLYDIRSFAKDYSLLENVYSYGYSFDILIYDLICFCNRSRLPTYRINPWFSLLLKRNFKFKKYTNSQLNKYIFIAFYRDSIFNPLRKIRCLLAALTPIERTKFINDYVLNEEEYTL
jgi:hypothetical protein